MGVIIAPVQVQNIKSERAEKENDHGTEDKPWEML